MLHGGTGRAGGKQTFFQKCLEQDSTYFPRTQHRHLFTGQIKTHASCLPHSARCATCKAFFCLLDCIHFQAVVTICSRERLAFHCRSVCARVGSATKAGGSPARRGATRVGTGRPAPFSPTSAASSPE